MTVTVTITCDHCGRAFERARRHYERDIRTDRTTHTYCTRECWLDALGHQRDRCGTRSSYTLRGCRCEECRAANAAYRRADDLQKKRAIVRQIRSMTIPDHVLDAYASPYLPPPRKTAERI